MKQVKCPKCGNEFFPNIVKKNKVLEVLKIEPKRFNELKREVEISAPYLNEILQDYIVQGKVQRNTVGKQCVVYRIKEEKQQ